MFHYKCHTRFFCQPLDRYIYKNADLYVYENRDWYDVKNSPWYSGGNSTLVITEWGYSQSSSLHLWFTDTVKNTFFSYIGQESEGDGDGIDDGDTTDSNTWSALKINNELLLKQDRFEKGIANGYASLDNTGKVPLSQLPPTGNTLGTQIYIADHTTKYIVVGNVNIDRIIVVEYSLETTDGVYYQSGHYKIVHNDADTNFDNEMLGKPMNVPNMIYSADIDNNNIRMIISASGVGSDVKMRYKIIEKIVITT